MRLSWLPPAGVTVRGYNVYRGQSDFTAKSGRVNSAILTATGFTDLPPEDGRYFYRVEVVSAAGNASDLSEPVTATADSTPPRALVIDYTPSGNHDPLTGRTAPGRVDITVRVSEPLLAPPFMSITPAGGIPVFIDLAEYGSDGYRGSFTIDPQTPSGTATVLFSARATKGSSPLLTFGL